MHRSFDGSAEQHFWPQRLGFAKVNLLWTDRMGHVLPLRWRSRQGVPRTTADSRRYQGWQREGATGKDSDLTAVLTLLSREDRTSTGARRTIPIQHFPES